MPKDITPNEVRELAGMGWYLGCDAEYDEEDSAKWENSSSLSDDELMELFNDYGRSVFKFE